jgi:hypothetical protein
MLELYFLIYRIPKMMSRLARERNKSALAWSLIGIGAWIGAELVVVFTISLIYALGTEIWGWPERGSSFSLSIYVLALLAALISVTVVSRILTRKPREESFPSPPPPPQQFSEREREDRGH